MANHFFIYPLSRQAKSPNATKNYNKSLSVSGHTFAAPLAFTVNHHHYLTAQQAANTSRSMWLPQRGTEPLLHTPGLDASQPIWLSPCPATHAIAPAVSVSNMTWTTLRAELSRFALLCKHARQQAQVDTEEFSRHKAPVKIQPAARQGLQNEQDAHPDNGPWSKHPSQKPDSLSGATARTHLRER